jgi:hypothetical protein
MYAPNLLLDTCHAYRQLPTSGEEDAAQAVPIKPMSASAFCSETFADPAPPNFVLKAAID